MRIKSAVDMAKKTAEPRETQRQETPEKNNRQENTFSYTRTKIIPVKDEDLLKNRVVTHDKSDARGIPFQMLRAKVLQEMRLNDWNSIAISAPTPGAGKSQVTVNLAISIAQEVNQTVLIVDMDLRRPSIHKYFNIQPEFGVSDYIDHNVPIDQIMINPGIERLVVMPSIKRTLNSSEQLSSPLIRDLTEELKSKYSTRIVIFDLPPLLVTDDVMVFLPYVDCSLLVVESGKNTKKEIDDSVDLLKSKPLLGTVLNKELDLPKIYAY